MCGSGTTLLAAVKLGRKAVGIDIDPIACDTTKKELSKVDLSAPYPSPPLASCDNPVI
jgi:DNA modification methylase